MTSHHITGAAVGHGDGVERVRVNLDARSYDIVVGRGILERVGVETARAVCGSDSADGRVALIVTNPGLMRPYGRPVQAALGAAGFDTRTMTLASGETRKTLGAVRSIYSTLCESACDRRTIIVALGGGVVGDVAGFAAASYQRGLDLVQIPTTLLAQVDSSVGGKVGVNFGSAKNLIGAFHQPRLVLIDPNTLRTLPIRERRSGLAEVIKYGAIADAQFFGKISDEVAGLLKPDSPFLAEAIARSCTIKAATVEADERDLGSRALLNFGHTVGHALEAATRYRRYRHGEAVAIGMVSASLIGEELGITPPDATAALVEILGMTGFKTTLDDDIDVDRILGLLALDKKSVSGASRFVLISQIGDAGAGYAASDAAIRAGLARQRRAA